MKHGFIFIFTSLRTPSEITALLVSITSSIVAKILRQKSKPTIFANPGADLNAKSLNQQKLRERLAMTEYYKLRNGGAAHRYWVRAGLERVVARTYAFKFNYAIKALFAYQLLTSYGNYRHIKKHSFMTAEQTVQHGVPVVTCAAALYLACAFI